jgi:hypothetical protein
MGPFAGTRRAGGLLATALSLLSLPGCAELHFDQGPNQVIQRTEGENNFALNQEAGPVAVRVLLYALLAEQSYDPRVYGTHRIAPRATACVADDGKPCDSADDRRAARWLSEWRYVWSCDGPDECRVQTLGRARPLEAWVSRSGRAWARALPKLSSPFAALSAGTKETGNPTSTGFCALSQSTTSTTRCATISATSSTISSATRATDAARLKSSPSVTRSAADWRSSRPIPIGASAASTRSTLRW